MTTLAEALEAGVKVVLPNAEERQRVDAVASMLMERTKAAAKEFWEVRSVVMGGSYAKGTWLPQDVDIDIFLKTSPIVKEKRFEQVGLAVGAKATEGYPRGKKYAQHPYTEATVDGVKVNIVPCYDIEPPNWKSAADRSPYHVALVERLPDRQKLQIRLLKRFMKALGVYGAEIEKQGFSGYVAEVLIMEHDDLPTVLQTFANFKPFSSEEFMHLPDPVDTDRDLARAISREKVGRMVLGCRAFLAKPTKESFGVRTGRRRPPILTHVYGLTFEHRPLSEDTLWGELKKTLKHVQTHLDGKGFRIARALAASNGSDSSALLYLPGFPSLPALEERVGPSVERKSETTEFIRKNSRKARLVWVGDDARVRLLQERRYTKVEEALAEVAKAGGLNIGASREMAEGIIKSGKVVHGARLQRLAAKRQWLEEALQEIGSDSFGTSPT